MFYQHHGRPGNHFEAGKGSGPRKLTFIEAVQKSSSDNNRITEVYRKISPSLSKLSKKIRKDPIINEGLENLIQQLKSDIMSGGRGSRKLAGRNSIY